MKMMFVLVFLCKLFNIGDTPLHIAARSRNLGLVEELIQQGAEINVANIIY